MHPHLLLLLVANSLLLNVVLVFLKLFVFAKEFHELFGAQTFIVVAHDFRHQVKRVNSESGSLQFWGLELGLSGSTFAVGFEGLKFDLR